MRVAPIPKVFHKHLSGGESTAPPPLGWAPGVGDGGETTSNQWGEQSKYEKKIMLCGLH